MKRIYQRQRITRTKTVLAHLNHAGAMAFDEITSAVLRGYRANNKPSLSLVIQSVLIQFARGLSSESSGTRPDELKELKATIKRHGYKPPKEHLLKINEVLKEAESRQECSVMNNG